MIDLTKRVLVAVVVAAATIDKSHVTIRKNKINHFTYDDDWLCEGLSGMR